jgi:hypothetical protein
MRYVQIILATVVCLVVFLCSSVKNDGSAAAGKPGVTKNAATGTTVSGDEKTTSSKGAAAVVPAADTRPSTDTLVITARLTEIPGAFAPNDLYNYVYIMKYRVVKVLRGSYSGEEILVGHYNPLIPRKQIHDKMARYAAGDVVNFRTGDINTLTLIRPIERIWKDAVEDEYFDSDLAKYYALRADRTK